MRPTLLAILGKPLSGKDTQADLLVAAHPESVNISTGRIMRSVSKKEKAHRFWPLVGHLIPDMEAGIKLQDEPIIEMIGQVVKEHVAEGKKLMVIAGSPRGLKQLEAFEGMARKANAELRFVYIDATDEEIYRRRAVRRGRMDDTPEVLDVRLDEFRMHVEPMLDKLRNERRLTEIDGMKGVETVFRALETEVRGHLLDPEIALPAMARR